MLMLVNVNGDRDRDGGESVTGTKVCDVWLAATEPRTKNQDNLR